MGIKLITHYRPLPTYFFRGRELDNIDDFCKAARGTKISRSESIDKKISQDLSGRKSGIKSIAAKLIFLKEEYFKAVLFPLLCRIQN